MHDRPSARPFLSSLFCLLQSSCLVSVRCQQLRKLFSKLSPAIFVSGFVNSLHV
ncbi:hypothetical protein BDE02_03G008600 [Populus trichocarpa]|nr:hypothetical protein BDE02_03G008600 [Populus trichocarpa]